MALRPLARDAAAVPRALKNLDITLGLAVIPVQLFTATSSQGVAFHLLHARCGTRIQMRLECPIHGIVPREETVKGYEIAKDEYVRFEPDELKALEQASSSALVIDSFVPEGAIDPVYFEDAYYVGAGKNGERGYRVLVEALRLLKAIEQKIAGQEIQRLEVEARPTTTDLVATLKASLERKGLAKAPPPKAEQEPTPAKRPTRRRRAS